MSIDNEARIYTQLVGEMSTSAFEDTVRAVADACIKKLPYLHSTMRTSNGDLSFNVTHTSTNDKETYWFRITRRTFEEGIEEVNYGLDSDSKLGLYEEINKYLDRMATLGWVVKDSVKGELLTKDLESLKGILFDSIPSMSLDDTVDVFNMAGEIQFSLIYALSGYRVGDRPVKVPTYLIAKEEGVVTLSNEQTLKFIDSLDLVKEQEE